MRQRITRLLIALSVSLPLVFIVVFLGYFPLHFDVVLRTDNIKGEGICQTYVCPTIGFAGFYKVAFYFGSELSKATIQGYHYDTNPISLIISDVSSFDITSIDSYVNGIHTGHFESNDILSEGEKLQGTTATLSSDNGSLHVEVNDPDVGTTISISKEFIPAWFWLVYITAIVLIAIVLAVLLDMLFKKIPAVEFTAISVSTIAVTLLAGCFFAEVYHM